jgi:hypothetical protein
MNVKCQRFPCEICSINSSIQVFYNNNGEAKYARARHYKGRLNNKPQFEYHQQSLSYLQRKLDQIPKNDKCQTKIHSDQNSNIDQQKPKTSTILEKKRASSSARIEHQPPKLGVEGSNPSPPATADSRTVWR